MRGAQGRGEATWERERDSGGVRKGLTTSTAACARTHTRSARTFAQFRQAVQVFVNVGDAVPPQGRVPGVRGRLVLQDALVPAAHPPQTHTGTQGGG